MEENSGGDHEPIQPERAKTTDYDGPVDAGGPRDGGGMAESRQPISKETAATPNSKFFGLPPDQLAGCSQADEILAESTGEGSIRTGHLEVLGKAEMSTSQPLCPQAADLCALRPSELTRMLNSTSLGTVISDRQLYRHRERAGFRIGERKKVDLFKYTAWLIAARFERQDNRTCKQRQRRQIQDSDPGACNLNVSEVLQLVQRQRRRCALTGRELAPEEAALDHVMPISRGGGHHIANAQILHKDVNRAKGVLTNEEFIAICREVAAHADSP